MAEALRIMAVGDLVLDEPHPERYFEPSAKVLQSADLVIGQVEVPHTTSTDVTSVDIPAPPADPAHVKAIADVGITIATLAGNHIFDCGTQGVLDTVGNCHAHGIATVGAGATIDDARRPAVVERRGRRVGVLAYNCVGPRESWATSRKAGCAFVNVLTHYELDTANPGGPPSVYSFCEPRSLKAMTDDVVRLRSELDVLVVALHKGIGHTPVEIADYEFQVAHAAIDAGADAVIAHHAHIMRGIEVYRNKPIFHGLGNFVTVTSALTLGNDDSPERQAWAKRRQKLFGFLPDPAMPTYAFHPDSRNTAIAVVDVAADGTVSAGVVPCWIDDEARPVPLGNDPVGRDVADYIQHITRDAELDTRFRWRANLLEVDLGHAAVPDPTATPALSERQSS
ncbi:CapA family protein [Intrasporangium sp.]|uniref:CapA family protein n=1 Tax=Intrasporangium sp. TaxID=1925024 RepID=UPI00293B7483|nr:CapA family protein [Intrasporangium sp.]MDV3223111.1 CapA family protein [Intrasporangium sp.]